ncbi:hypothetical protein FLJC2902T_22180 [Flavobacterium limnosediminis JC2902]|uniref:DUF3703 domain-containing protein n=2 Tax=Flavobacterium TaxID=237 RepID=V6SRR2_9FLAO|nr:hypothetical protein FLJC2902T_22180 [Flavobacterium limnosediminis JC2902]
MPKALVPYFEKEIDLANMCLASDNFKDCWHHLERAHVIGQKYAYAHTYTHWKMLQFGFKIKSRKEIIGQIPRLLVGGIKSFVGHIPVGNTGGSDVSPLQPMEIPKDIQEIFRNNC